MEYCETIIVGGGPAGSSCGWKLKRHGRQVLILDRQTFPRLKLCAGWITSKVMENLEFTPDDYPHSLLKMKTKMYIAPLPFPLIMKIANKIYLVPFSLGGWPTEDRLFHSSA